MESLQRGAKFETVLDHTKHTLSHANQLRWVKVQSLTCPDTIQETKCDFEGLLGYKFNNQKRIFNAKGGVNITGITSIERWPKAIKTCNKYGANIIINVWGDLTACCWDCTRLQCYGNIYGARLIDILKSDLIRLRRDQLKCGDTASLPLCAKCLGESH